jgi:hypothetical protein
MGKCDMSPEYAATMGFFPVDHVTFDDHLKLTGWSDETVCSLPCKLFFLLLLHWYFVANIIMKYFSMHTYLGIFLLGMWIQAFSSWLCSLGTVPYLFLKVTC